MIHVVNIVYGFAKNFSLTFSHLATPELFNARQAFFHTSVNANHEKVISTALPQGTYTHVFVIAFWIRVRMNGRLTTGGPTNAL